MPSTAVIQIVKTEPADFIEEPDVQLSDQLNLPLPMSKCAWPDVWDGDAAWPAGHQILVNYLDQLNVLDPKRVAEQLLRDFRSISDLLAASWWSLRRTAGSRLASSICASRDLMRAALLEEASTGPIIRTRDEVLHLLRAELGSLKREHIVALYLDTKLRLLRLERITEGSVRGATIDTRRIIHRGLDVGAAGFLLVHNHPSGDPTPSPTDRRAMAHLRRLVAEFDMHLLDALVVAGGEVRSVFEER